MPHEFEDPTELSLPVSADQVWEAVATGPGLTSWFMGATDVDVTAGTVHTTMGGFAMSSHVVAHEPRSHFAFRGDTGPDGRFFAMEFLLEAREPGATVLRVVSSGFLPGDDWEDEYETMRRGGRVYLATLVGYLTHFAGRTAFAVTVSAPPGDQDAGWAAVRADLGVQDAAEGDQVTLHPTGLPTITGVVDVSTSETLGIRTDDALLRFFRGYVAPSVGHHVFTTQDPTPAWRTWLATVCA